MIELASVRGCLFTVIISHNSSVFFENISTGKCVLAIKNQSLF